MASVLREIYKRHQQGRMLSDGERDIARGLLKTQDTDRDLLNIVSRVVVLVAPVTGTTPEEQQASITEYAAKCHLLETLVAGNLTMDDAGRAASLIE